MERTYRIEILSLEPQGNGLLGDIAALGIDGVERVVCTDLYFLPGVLAEADVARLANELLADPITQRARWDDVASPVQIPPETVSVEVGLLPGVTDSVADNLVARAHMLGMEQCNAAATGQRYLLYGTLSDAQVQTIAQKLLCNAIIQHYAVARGDDPTGGAHLQPDLSGRNRVSERNSVSNPAVSNPVPIRDLDEAQLQALSRRRLLSMDVAELRAVQRYFAAEGREPTDVELESIAQTWSEHCGHKTFKGVVDYTEITPEGTTRQHIDSLIRTFLQAATNKIAAPWVRSAFVDNAGILDFAPGYEVSFKVETHNHPSALEPFGGANTGVGGVVRDIIGVSARPIANTDVLCFGPLDLPMQQVPGGVLHPRRIYNGVVHGVQDYGNKMGIPTVNGAIYFDPGYTANPLVYCGCVGIAPLGRHRNDAQPGDLIVVLGGRTGRDGLHGATFSSAELTDSTGETTGGAVQIGNPIIEKKVLDAILVARDAGLYSAITDCGAGGLSSAVSEMGENTGVHVQLEKVELKYQGLQPWEIWLSEAQERMVLAIPPANEAQLQRICDGYSVEMTVIGTFSGDRRLLLSVGYDVGYGDQARRVERVVADMAMSFLHKGIPRRHLTGTWQSPALAEPEPAMLQGDLAQALLDILAMPNVRSKEDVVRRYDHEVLGGTVIKPFVGVANAGPADATVLRPLEVAHEYMGLALGCGFNPAYGAIDPYAMAVSAIDEAVRNVVCVGADPQRIAILDNFCWGNPLLTDRMGSLVRACKGCYDGALQYETPFVSGKDSLNNEYTDTATGKQVSIPPSLLISALGMVPDVRHGCTSDLKRPGNLLYLLGETRPELGGSCYYRLSGQVGTSVPRTAQAGPATACALHRAMSAGLVASCHDCSEGGLAVALAEMALGGRLGAQVRLGDVPHIGNGQVGADAWLLYAESNGRYVVEISPEARDAFEALMNKVPCACIGSVSAEATLSVTSSSGVGEALCLPVERLERAWRGHLALETRFLSKTEFPKSSTQEAAR